VVEAAVVLQSTAMDANGDGVNAILAGNSRKRILKCSSRLARYSDSVENPLSAGAITSKISTIHQTMC
jgi:hypothetical protein